MPSTWAFRARPVSPIRAHAARDLAYRLLRMIDIPFVATYVSENDGVRLKSSEA